MVERTYPDRSVEDLELDREMLLLISRLFVPDRLSQVAIVRSIETALSDSDLSLEDQETVRLWLKDVATGKDI